MKTLVRFLAAAVALLVSPFASADGTGARVVPAETMLLIELHDFQRTAARWKETAYWQIAQEPEWKAFTAKLGNLVDLLPKDEQGQVIRGVLADLAKVQISGGFFAIGEVPDFTAPEPPRMLAGISFRGERDIVSSYVAGLLAKAADGEPKPVKTTKDGVEIHTLPVGNLTISLAFSGQWLLAATQENALIEMIARHTGKSPPGLVETTAWKNGTKQALAEPDMTLFLAYDALMKTMSGFGGAETEMLKAMENHVPEVWHTTAKLDGRTLRERSYFHYKNELPKPAAAHRSLGFSGADTFAYFDTDYSGWEDIMKVMFEAVDDVGGIPGLEEHGLGLADIATTFGPEFALLSDWEEGALAMPTAFLALEVRDAAKAKAFAGLITAAMKAEGNVREREVDGTKLWTLVLEIPVVKPTLALNDKHLMIGLNTDSVLTPLKRMKNSAPSLASDAAFNDARKTVVEANGGLAYVDSKRLFERLYDRGRPFIANAIAGSPVVSEFLDAGLLPKSEMFSRHLPPLMVSLHSSGKGYLMESNGPVTYITGTLGAALAAGFALPAFTSAKASANLARALNNTRQLALAARMYANDNAGKYPAKLEDLIPRYLDDATLLRSPFDPDDEETAYEITEAKDSDPADKVLIKSKYTTPDGRRVIAHLDGSVRLSEE